MRVASKVRNVLVVDDEVQMTETLKDILEEKGFSVVVAGNGFDAIDKIKETDFDLVLMDIKMPEINGVETLKEIKKINQTVMVVMMTAYAFKELEEEAIKEGAYGIFYKPLDIDRILDLLEVSKEDSLIMVVDDDENSCETLKDILEMKNRKVVCAYGGREAIEIAQRKRVDIVFIDIKMPVLNGVETYLELKELNPKIIAILMTGYRQEVSKLVDEGMRNSVYICLSKPLDIDIVSKHVNEISQQIRCGFIMKPGK